MSISLVLKLSQLLQSLWEANAAEETYHDSTSPIAGFTLCHKHCCLQDAIFQVLGQHNRPGGGHSHCLHCSDEGINRKLVIYPRLSSWQQQHTTGLDLPPGPVFLTVELCGFLSPILNYRTSCSSLSISRSNIILLKIICHIHFLNGIRYLWFTFNWGAQLSCKFVIWLVSTSNKN